MKTIHGIIPPVITPFERDYSVNESALRSFVRHLLGCGVHGIVPCGSTGEYPLLTSDERRRVAEVVTEEAGGRIPVIVGVSAVRNEDAVMFAKHAERIGADGVLAAPTYYYKPSEKELYTYYKDIASVGLPVVVYNIPGTTKVDMKPEFLVKLSNDFDNIKHVKECTGDISRVTDIIRMSNGKVKVLCGEDPLIFEFFCIDPVGAISSASNVLAKELVALYRLFINNDLKDAKNLFFRMSPLLKCIDNPKFVQNVKAALATLGYDPGPTRKPLLRLEKGELAALKRLLRAAKIK